MAVWKAAKGTAAAWAALGDAYRVEVRIVTWEAPSVLRAPSGALFRDGEKWAVYTVENGRAASHRERGWEKFTDAVIRLVAARPDPVVFILWGSYAQKKAAFVEDVARGGRHLVLKAPHPSPLSAHAGFFGSKPFSRTNAFLEGQGSAPIDWQLPEL